MEEEHIPGKASATTASTSDDGGDDVVSEEEFRKGLLKAVKHRAQRKKMNIKLSPERRDELLQDSFPKVKSADGGSAKVKELSRAEYAALRSSLQKVVRVEVQEKIRLLRAQLSEYHSVLEDCIAYKSKCEQLEQEKQDLESRNREECQLRDHKIEKLERELARLRNERHSVSSTTRVVSNSDWVSSIISGASESEGSEEHPPQLSLALPLPSTQLHRRMNNNPSSHQYHITENETRRISSRSISPSSLKALIQNHRSDSAFNLGVIRPLPFPGELASHMYPQPRVDHRGAFACPPSIGEDRSPKRNRSS